MSLSRPLLVLGSALLSLSSSSEVPDLAADHRQLSSLTVDEVQTWLASHSLDNVFGEDFLAMQVDGVLLAEYLTPQDVELGGKKTTAHRRRLFDAIQKETQQDKLAESLSSSDLSAAGAERRRLASSSASGIQIKRDDACVTFGAESDVTMQRTGDGTLRLVADSLVLDSHDALQDTEGNKLVDSLQPWDTVFVGDKPVEIKQSQLITTTFQAAAEFEITVDIKPTETYNGWSNVFHFTVTGENCCNYGDRIPGVWLKANTGTVLLVSGSAYDLDEEEEDGNSHEYSDIELPMNQWTTMTFRAEGPTATVSFNGTEVMSMDTDIRHPHDNTMVYLSDPWYEPAHAWVKNFKYRTLSLLQSGAYEHSTDSQTSLGQLGHVTNVPFDLNVEGKVFVDSFDDVVAADGSALTDAFGKWTHQFVGSDPVDVKKSQLLTTTFQAAADFEITIDIKPYDTYNGWSNIFHFTVTGDDCCSYGDRIPAIWLKANTGTMLLVSGSAYDLDTGSEDGNSHGYSSVELEEDSWTTVTIRAVGPNATVAFDGENVLTIDTHTRHPHDRVSVWLSDPWYASAPVYVRNFKYRVLSYIQTDAYDHDLDSVSSLGQTDTTVNFYGDLNVEGSVILSSYENVFDSSGLSLADRADDAVTTFVGDSAIEVKDSQLITSDFQAVAEYEIEIDVKLLETYNGWSNIFHLTVTGEDCCNYGDRIPAAWFKANTGTVTYVSGSAYDLSTDDDNGNDHGYSDVQIPIGQWTTIKFQAIGQESKMYFNDTLVLTLETQTRHPHAGAAVYLSDPWYEPAHAMVKNFKYKALSNLQTDAYDHEFDSAGALGQYD